MRNKVNPDEMTLFKLFGILTIRQLWSILGALAIIIGGTFSISQFINNSKIDDLDRAHRNKIENIQSEHSIVINKLMNNIDFLNQDIKSTKVEVKKRKEQIQSLRAHEQFFMRTFEYYRTVEQWQKKQGHHTPTRYNIDYCLQSQPKHHFPPVLTSNRNPSSNK